MAVATKQLQRNRALERESSPPQSGEFTTVSSPKRRSVLERFKDKVEDVKGTLVGVRENLAKPTAQERWDDSDFESIRYGPKTVIAKKEAA